MQRKGKPCTNTGIKRQKSLDFGGEIGIREAFYPQLSSMLKQKKIWIWILLCAAAFVHLNVSAFQQQGFSTYQEWYNNSMNFSCESQCIVLLWTLGSNDYLRIQGAVEGQGTMGFWFLVGQQVAPGPMMNIGWQWAMDQRFSFSDVQFISQIPKEAQVLLIVQGNVKGSEVKADLRFLSLFQKFDQWWKDFWVFDAYKPYTINFLYGPKMFGKSANDIFYRIFAIICAILLFKFWWKSKKFTNWVLILLCALWVVYWIRMYSELYTYRKADYQNRVKPEFAQKTFRDDGDLYQFIDFVKTNLFTWTACIHSAPYKSWDFDTKTKYHLYPEIDMASTDTWCEYILIYNEPSYIYDWTWKMLTKDGSGIATGEIYKIFNQTSFIFKKS